MSNANQMPTQTQLSQAKQIGVSGGNVNTHGLSHPAKTAINNAVIKGKEGK